MSEKVCIETRENVHYFPDMEKCEEFIRTTIMADWDAWTDETNIYAFKADEYDALDVVKAVKGFNRFGDVFTPEYEE